MNEGSGSNSKKRQVSLEEIPMAHASSNTNSSVAMLNSPVDSLDDKVRRKHFFYFYPLPLLC